LTAPGLDIVGASPQLAVYRAVQQGDRVHRELKLGYRAGFRTGIDEQFLTVETVKRN
jgi:hypothetical protein